MSLTDGMMVFSGSVSIVFLFTLSPQTPSGRRRLLTHVAKLQLTISQLSSVHLHHTPSPLYIVAFFPHLNKSQFAEQDFDVAKTSATPSKRRIHISCGAIDSFLANRATANARNKLFLELTLASTKSFRETFS